MRMTRQKDTYGEAKKRVRRDGGVDWVLRPILTEEERARRMEQIARAAAELVYVAEEIAAERERQAAQKAG